MAAASAPAAGAPAVASLPLLSGYSMPAIGLGTWRTDNAVLKGALLHALAAGWRHFDCAAMYMNEGIIGEAIEEAIQAGVCTRADLFLTSKLLPTEAHVGAAAPALARTLAALRTPYLDLYLLHWPHRFPAKPSAFPVPPEERLGYAAEDVAAVWAELERCGVDAGLVRSLGVSNFSVAKMEALWAAARHKPVNNQVEMHPALQQPELLAWHAARRVVVTTYCPLGSPARPPTFRPTGDADPDILGHPTIAALAAKHGRTPAQVVLRWAIQRGTVPLPKSVTPSRLEENLAAATAPGWALGEEDMAAIAAMDRHFRFSRGQAFAPAGQTWVDVWDEPEGGPRRLGVQAEGGAGAGAGATPA
jgi:alcohol dehydrogenase (NADP+)